MGIDNLNDYYDIQLKKDRLEQLVPFESFSFSKLDMTDQGGVATLFVGHYFQRVIHLAAQPGVRYSRKNRMSIFKATLWGLPIFWKAVGITKSSILSFPAALVFMARILLYLFRQIRMWITPSDEQIARLIRVCTLYPAPKRCGGIC